MPNINTMKASKFLKRDDVGRGMLVTISHVSEENVAKEGAPDEMKWCAHFDETDKPLVLNWTNLQLIARIAKNDDSDTWNGTKVVLFDDPNVSFGGKITGGIRVREAKQQAGKPKGGLTNVPPVDEDEEDGGIPF